MIEIFTVKTGKDIEVAKILFREFDRFLKERLGKYAEFPWAVEHWKNLEEEINNLLGDYAPPEGCLLLARYEGEDVGCVGLKQVSNGICEMKRLYVRPNFRRLGIGKGLANAVIEKARQSGYHSMRLGTNRLLDAALKLYTSLGFKQSEPYIELPVEIEDLVVSMELKLV
jgi:GNAT superfamily N-acetyltransferase